MNKKLFISKYVNLMILIENHNSCVGKYREKLTREMEMNGIPPKYLLSACRFHLSHNVPIHLLKMQFTEWNRFVITHTPMNVNMLSYENFKNTIRKNKREFAIPNKIYDDGKVSIGEIKSNKDVSNFPIKHHWVFEDQNNLQSIHTLEIHFI